MYMTAFLKRKKKKDIAFGCSGLRWIYMYSPRKRENIGASLSYLETQNRERHHWILVVFRYIDIELEDIDQHPRI